MPSWEKGTFRSDCWHAIICGAACGLFLSHATFQPRNFLHDLQTLRLQTKATEIAEIYNLDPSHFRKVIECESQWDPNIQSGYFLSDGTQENSWGIAQFNLDTNDMTKAEALDPKFALTKMAEHWSQGRASSWACYRLWSARNWI
jgi:hypothetical protein